jgi:hypothetical protein
MVLFYKFVIIYIYFKLILIFSKINKKMYQYGKAQHGNQNVFTSKTAKINTERRHTSSHIKKRSEAIEMVRPLHNFQDSPRATMKNSERFSS